VIKKGKRETIDNSISYGDDYKFIPAASIACGIIEKNV